MLKCNQCNRSFPELVMQLNRKTGDWYKNCQWCRTERAGGRSVVKTWRVPGSEDDELRVVFTLRSGNRKTGPIPVSTSSPGTCPPSCSWRGNGCYAETSYAGARWRKVPERGMSWGEFCVEVMKLPYGQLWRHNEAGDLPGRGELVDYSLLAKLVCCNWGKRGFTYTHKRSSHHLLREVCDAGFTINVSCDSVDAVDRIRAQGSKLPLTVVVPSDAPARFRTPGGTHVVTCPAQLHEHITCESCQLCAVPTRKSVVAFRAHGNAVNIVSRRAANRVLPLVV